MTVKDKDNPEGDIEIIFTGLRPGEKLYEELLIGGNVSTTEHEKIMRITEEDLKWEELQEYLSELEQAAKLDDFDKIREIFQKTVFGYNPQSDTTESNLLQKKG